MKKILFLILTTFFFINSNGQTTEGMFIELHILASAKLNNTAKVFERKLTESSSNDTIVKYIDGYSQVIEETIPFYRGNNQLKNTSLKEPFNDVSELLTDILNNNYEMLGKVVNNELSETEIKSASTKLINKNKFTSQFIGQITLGIFEAIVKDRPKGSSNDKQYSKLTQKDANKIKTNIVQLFGERIKQTDVSKMKNGYEMSANILYQGLNLEWEYEKK